MNLALSVIDRRDEVLAVAFPYFGGRPHERFAENDQGGDVLVRNVPVKRVALADGEAFVTTVFDLVCANYGLDRGLGGACAKSFAENVAYTPAWQEPITGVAADKAIAVAREFAHNAEKTRGRSMVIIGAGVNHWYHQDMTYRSIINFLMMCGTIGDLRRRLGTLCGPGEAPATDRLDDAHVRARLGAAAAANERYLVLLCAQRSMALREDRRERIAVAARRSDAISRQHDRSQRARGADGLAALGSAARHQPADDWRRKPTELASEVKEHVVGGLKEGRIRMACEDPDNPVNFPRNLFIWRSNLFGSSGKGHEYFLRHFLGTRHGSAGQGSGRDGRRRSREEVVWRDPAPEGKLDLVVTLDFRMSTSCLYSDIVLPTATWYEKNDLNTTDMHPFIHPLSAAVDPVWESRSDWETYKTIARRFSELAVGHLGVERDVVLTPIQHDTAAELAQPFEVKDWKKGECELVPGVTAPQITVVERDYPNTYRRFTALGPLADKLGNGGKGIDWNTEDEVQGLGETELPVTTTGRQRAGRGSRPTSTRPRSSSISRRRPTARSRSRRGRRSAK